MNPWMCAARMIFHLTGNERDLKRSASSNKIQLLKHLIAPSRFIVYVSR